MKWTHIASMKKNGRGKKCVPLLLSKTKKTCVAIKIIKIFKIYFKEANIEKY